MWTNKGAQPSGGRLPRRLSTKLSGALDYGKDQTHLGVVRGDDLMQLFMVRGAATGHGLPVRKGRPQGV